MQFADLSKAFRRYWPIGLLAFVVTMAIGFAAAYLPEERYRSTATVLVSPNLAEIPLGSFEAVSFVLPTLVTEMQSRTFELAARERIDPSVDDSSVTVTVALEEDDASLITVLATSHDPDAAAAAADAWAAHAAANPPATTLVSVRVLDPAEVASSPYTPVRPPILFGSAVLALIAAVFASLAAAAFGRRALGTRELLDRFGTNVLGEIPKLSRRESLGDGTVGFTVSSGRPHVVEAFQTLRTNLELMSASADPRAIAITSTKPHEGKSTIAAHLSSALASVGQDVALVDVDLRRPSLHTLLNQSSRPGVSEAGWLPMSELVRQVGQSSLLFVPAGAPTRHPAEVIRENLGAVMAGLTHENRLVLLDCPTLGGIAESSLIVSTAGWVVLVIDANTDLDEVEATLARLQELGVGLLGVVINRAPRRRGRSRYYFEQRRHDDDYPATPERPTPPGRSPSGGEHGERAVPNRPRRTPVAAVEDPRRRAT